LDLLQTGGGNSALIDSSFLREDAFKVIVPVPLQQDADIFSLGDMLQAENIRVVAAAGLAPRQD
jgi:hypothetical protein